MNSLAESIKNIYVKTTGYSYTNLGRLFLRLFVGLMLLQFGVRQMLNYDTISDSFPAAIGMTPTCTLIIMIVIEVVCSLFIMSGFLTRLMTLPPFIAMAIGEFYILHNQLPNAPYMLSWSHEGYLPIMFMGIYFFIMLVGPGKISVDYFLSLHILHSADKSESELEEV